MFFFPLCPILDTKNRQNVRSPNVRKSDLHHRPHDPGTAGAAETPEMIRSELVAETSQDDALLAETQFGKSAECTSKLNTEERGLEVENG